MPEEQWPEWLTPEHTNMHRVLTNAMKRALGHCYASADASGYDWTMEGLFSVAANSILGDIKRAGNPPLRFEPVAEEPMPECYYDYEDDEGEL